MNSIDNPIYNLVHPGFNLKAELTTRGIKQNELAAEIGVLPSQLNEVLKGKRPITSELALLIGAATDIDPGHWVTLQANYNLNQAKIEESNKEKIKQITEWRVIKSLIPVSYFRKQGEIIGDLSKDISKIFKIFRVKNLSDLQLMMADNGHGNIYFRKSSKLSEHVPTINAWTKYIQYLSENQTNKPFSFDSESNLMNDIKAIIRGNNVLENLKKTFNKYGIAFIVKEKPEKAPIDGATFWHNNRPVIVITLRYKRFDNLIFTLLHEIGHIFLHLKFNQNDLFVDSLEDARDQSIPVKEEEANEYAKNHIIAPEKWDSFINTYSSFSDREIEKLALQVSIPAVSIWGRLCFEGRVSYSAPSKHRDGNNIP